ncbi:PEP-CTERM sorting domain-containing protein [Nitrosovibrio sp. Nv17]|jgi:hypothetical protein|uniref:PEP-CTERM sorting domain-containing protein n=1 Tax=Nitrosovibrio sp. Nv17 TaxID=1855339 RepID=UPI00090863D2|nr:PEP-CTERM sorting domain-containing protein [Nitrosovibrio sp. Nv17]SFW33529.1 PEP-CTERM protein-sorting domain-containing protein [Nitrosovibrio sp. Nv17]
MSKLTKGAVIILATGLAGAAGAVPITWDTTAGTRNHGNAGNTYTFTAGGEVLKARAYATSNSNGTGAFQKATINIFDGGIGVRSPGEGTGSPNHATDNAGRDEFVVFEFGDGGYNPVGFEIGWRSNDSDVRAWIGGETLGAGYDFTGEKVTDLAGLGFSLFNFSNVSINHLASFGTDLVGRYLILAPQQVGGNFDKKEDYFKISAIAGNLPVIEVPPPDPDPQVPVSEPGTLALLGIALTGLWASGRRRGV